MSESIVQFAGRTWIPAPPKKTAAELRVDRIVAFLAGSDDPIRDFFAGVEVKRNDKGIPDWYPPDLDPDISVQVSQSLWISRDCSSSRPSAYCPVTNLPPRDPIEYNLFRIARHKKLLRLYETALTALHRQLLAERNLSVVLMVPFQWDTKAYGKAPVDTLGNLLPEPAKKRLEALREYHGDMASALDKYLRTLGVEPERRIIS